MTSLKPDYIHLSPIGDFPPELLDPIALAVQKAFGFRVAITPILQDIRFAWDSGRNQYHSTPILDRLAAEVPPEALKVAALCREDLFIPILTYVYGEAQLGGRACIVSSYRLEDGLNGREPGDRFVSRMAKETIHELGHTFDLRHCRDSACLMHYCRNESDVDRKSEQFCRYCKVLVRDALEKLN